MVEALNVAEPHKKIPLLKTPFLISQKRRFNYAIASNRVGSGKAACTCCCA